MIANFNKRTGVVTSKPEMWNTREHRHDSPSATLVERVCSFLEVNQLLPADGGRIVPSASIGTTVLRGSGHVRTTRR